MMNCITGKAKCWLPALLACLLWGCSLERNSRPEGDVLRLLPYASRYAQPEPATKTTVTAPTSYNPYSSIFPRQNGVLPDFGVFFTLSGVSQTTSDVLRYQTGDDVWLSSVKLKTLPYYLYGYMPSDLVQGATILPLNSDYANGARLILSGLEPVMQDDPCIIVGVHGVRSREADANLQLGNFLYQGQNLGENYVYLLLDHLYARLNLNLRIGSRYHALRDIKVKSLSLSVPGAATVTATATLTGNSSGTTPFTSLSFSATGSNYSLTTVSSNEGILLDESQALSTTVCFAPGMNYPTLGFKLVTVYDVYDSQGNLIQANRRAENDLSRLAAAHSLQHGQQGTVNLTVNPDFLYQLSDPDLDNPTITLSE